MSNDHKVTLTPKMQGGQITWEMQYGTNKGFGPDSYPAIDLGKDSGPHKIEFKIESPGNITFVNGPAKGDIPIYIQEIPKGQTTKPTKGVVNYQISNITVSSNGKKLSLTDANHGAERTLSYQLNFNNAPPLDPIITNGGGTGPGAPMQEYALYGAGALLLIALVAFFLYRGRRSTGVGPGSH